MTADERTDRLETRVDRLEDQYREDVAAIHAKIDALVSAVNASMLGVAKTTCPAPGSCVPLSAELKSAIAFQTATMLRIERQELRILALEKWQWKVIGGGAVLMALLTLFGPDIRQLLRLE